MTLHAAFANLPLLRSCMDDHSLVSSSPDPDTASHTCAQDVDTGNHSWANYFLAAYKVRRFAYRVEPRDSQVPCLFTC